MILSPNKKKKKRPRKFKDVFDILENTTDEEFLFYHKRLSAKNLEYAGWFYLKRIELKGYAPL